MKGAEIHLLCYFGQVGLLLKVFPDELYRCFYFVVIVVHTVNIECCFRATDLILADFEGVEVKALYNENILYYRQHFLIKVFNNGLLIN